MKKPEEIKYDLAAWGTGIRIDIGNGEYVPPNPVYMMNGKTSATVCRNALAYIQQLEADSSRKDDTIRSLTEQLNAAHEETAKAMRERDAAKSDLDNSAPCFACIHFRRNGGECGGGSACWEEMHRCINSNEEYTGISFFWRGVCPENTEVQDE